MVRRTDDTQGQSGAGLARHPFMHCRTADIHHAIARALYRASHYGKIKILLPMLASLGELDQALTLIAAARGSLRVAFPSIGKTQMACMIEVPAAALAAEWFARTRFPVVHQRSDPIHARYRPHRRCRRAFVRSAASGGFAVRRPHAEGRSEDGQTKLRSAAKWQEIHA